MAEEISPQDRQIFIVVEELARDEAFGALMKALGVPLELLQAANEFFRNPTEKPPEFLLRYEDPRPKWVRTLAKKFTDTFTLVITAKGKSEAWKMGSGLGVLASLLSKIRDKPESFTRILPALTAFEGALRREIDARLSAPSADAADFFSGLGHGMKNPTYPSGLPSSGSHRVFLDFLLLSWEEVEKCRTKKELYYKLLGQEKPPPQWLGDLEAFQKYCGDLGIRLGARGRPKKSELIPKTTS